MAEISNSFPPWCGVSEKMSYCSHVALARSRYTGGSFDQRTHRRVSDNHVEFPSGGGPEKVTDEPEPDTIPSRGDVGPELGCRLF